MQYRLRTLLIIWLVTAPILFVKFTEAGNDAEMAIPAILLAGLTATLAYCTFKSFPSFRYKLRTLLISIAVIPPVASLIWFMYTHGMPPTLRSLPIVIPTVVATGIVISWLDDLVEYVSHRRLS